MTTAEVVVVGAGPAGIRAAVEAAAAGAQVLLVDDGARPGGQIYRQLPPEFRPAPRDPLAPSREKSRVLFDDLEHAAVTVWTGAEVWGVFPERVLAIHRAGRATVVQAGALVLATGACDRPVAVPGWTLPGVVTAGGVTALVKGQRILPGRRVLLAGTGPLLLAAAVALVQGGAEVVGLAEAAPRRALVGLLRRPGILGQALDVMASLWRTPIWGRHGIVRIEGTEGVERAVVAEVDDAWRPVVATARTLDVDTVVIGYGLVPSTELAQLAGCAVLYHAGRGGWIPVAEPEQLMATSAPGVFVAGDGAGVGGADVAEAQGRLAGLGAARHVGKLSETEALGRADAALRKLRRLAAFRQALEWLLAPRPGLYELATDDTIVCRCEEVSAGEIRAAIEEGARQVTEVRAVTRCGMGLCQGRMCVPTVAGLLARWAGVPAEKAGRLTARPPVRPIPLTVLADEVLESVPAPARA